MAGAMFNLLQAMNKVFSDHFRVILSQNGAGDFARPISLKLRPFYQPWATRETSVARALLFERKCNQKDAAFEMQPPLCQIGHKYFGESFALQMEKGRMRV